MKKFLVLFFAAACLGAKAQNNDAVYAYIDQYKQLAIDEMLRTGVPASITLAQGILESNAGQCPLTQQSNNHFGIKCKTDWAGDVVYHDDDTRHECFRRYNSAEDSYRDHSNFLKTRPNYAFLFDLDVTDYTHWAYGLKSAGYATNPAYATSIITTIEKYNLEQYTDIALHQSHEINVASSNVQPQQQFEFKNAAPLQSEENKQAITQTNVQQVQYPDGVFRINQANVLYVKPGTSLFAIATQYDIPYKKLLEYNDLDNVDIVQQAMLVYLEKKPKRGAKDFHIVQPNEKLHDIAQEEGVQLQSLMAYNNYQKDNQPKPGDKIILRSENKKLF